MRNNIFVAAVVGLLLGSVGWAARPATAEKEFLALEHEWKQAVVSRDVAFLRHFYAEEYTSTDPEGMVWNKTQDIEIDTAGQFRITAFKLDDVQARVYGDVAIVTGRDALKGTFLGKAASTQVRFTDVFVKRDGRWQCVTTQVTPIVKE
jgi:ketosteroid isomerase-like protein